MSRKLRMFLFILLVLSLASLSLAQDENYTQQGLAIARELIEEERGSPLQIARWQYLQEDWSTQANWQQYGSFGIDSCVAETIQAEKRDIIFGWTFTITDVYGKSWQVRVSFDLLAAVLCDEVITTAPASRPAAASAPVDISPGAARVGNFELGGQVTGLTEQAADLMRSAGMKWVKSQIPFDESNASVELGKRYIQDAQAKDKDFKILLSVKGAHGDLIHLRDNFDNYTDRFAAFLCKLAQAGADAIEVWNEPNIDREWPNALIKTAAADYTKMLEKAYKAIKSPECGPRTMVISGAPAPTGYAGSAGCDQAKGVCNDDIFMQQMAQEGAARYMDCLGLHYNEGALPPSAASGDPRGEYPTRYFNSMLNRGAQFFPGKPVCWTEIGYLTSQGFNRPLPDNFTWAKDTTVQQQADWIAEAAVRSAQSGQVRLMIVWNINFRKWEGDPQAGYALLRPDGSCPGCDTLRQAMGG